MERLLSLCIGYIFGLFQTAYIYGKANHIDIRDFGSGNAGTTNAMRVLGKKAGIITYLGDCLKAILACVVVYLIFRGETVHYRFILRIYTGLGVVLGHNFPFYMGFKGGKGIAASSGVIIGLADFKIMLISLFVFVFTTVFTKYVSVGSLALMFAFFVELIIFNELGILGLKSNLKFTGNERIEIYILILVISGLAFIKHSANIKRLIEGNERKIGQKKEV